MYTAVSAIGVRFGVGKRWEEITLANFTIKQLVETFRRAQFKLTLPSVPAPKYLSLRVLRDSWPTDGRTLAQLLVDLGNTALPTTDTGLAINVRSAYYRDVMKAGYTITPVTEANNDNPSIALDQKTHARLTRLNPATDYTNFFKRTMVSVNGFYHLTDTDGVKGVVVADATRSLRHSRQNQMGLLTFQSMGDLEFVPLKDEMIEQADPGEARIHLGKDLTNKTVFLVLGGYFMVVDPLNFSRIGDSSYLIDFNNLPMKDRWYESSRYLDLSDLPVSSTPLNDQEILASDLTSDAFIRAYLKLSQTFFVILDTPEVWVQKQFIKSSRLPDMYVSYKEPKWPIVTWLGRQPEYWSTFEDGQWSLTVYDNVVARRMFNTVNQVGMTGIDDANEPPHRADLSPAYFLQIGRDV